MTATVLAHGRGPKILIGKYRKRTGYKRHNGFRAATSQVEITLGAGAKRAGREEREAGAKAEAPKPPPPSRQPERRSVETKRRGRRRKPPTLRAPARRLRGDDGRAGQRRREGMEPRRARGGARLRTARRGAQGRPRGARVGDARKRLRWRTRRVSARRRTAATRIRSTSASRSSPARTSVPGRSSSASAGTRFRPGPGTKIGRDDTIFAVRDGKAEFRRSGERRSVSVVDAGSRSAGRGRVQRSRADPRQGRPRRRRRALVPAREVRPEGRARRRRRR